MDICRFNVHSFLAHILKSSWSFIPVMLPTGIPARLFRPCPPKVKLKHAVVRFVASTRPLATVPTSGPDVNLVGQCNFDGNVETIQRRIPLASTIRLANSGASELREEFLRFFRLANHTQVAPSTVFPKQHEGSYFVNAGMSQFKPLFLQQTDHSASTPFANLRRATNSQPCIRIGGRLDDLNDVGYDRQHHTMFEMLGNWSFGDYYKKEACQYMWTFLTKVLGLPPNALYVTYFGGCPQHGLPPDDETRDIWLDLG
ncbi:unnamed protein product [Dicrocoelium dendriticum]|nr:unnamed protein product [Dicrocoelium dendriticum]